MTRGSYLTEAILDTKTKMEWNASKTPCHFNRVEFPLKSIHALLYSISPNVTVGPFSPGEVPAAKPVVFEKLD